jgi:hypothetical protein
MPIFGPKFYSSCRNAPFDERIKIAGGIFKILKTDRVIIFPISKLATSSYYIWSINNTIITISSVLYNTGKVPKFYRDMPIIVWTWKWAYFAD